MLGCFAKKKKDLNGKFRKPYYHLRSYDCDKVLELRETDGKAVQLVINQVNGEDNQKFAIKQKGPDFFVKCKKDQMYLTVDGPMNGARVYATKKDMGENQRFRLNEIEPGSKKYVIYSHFGKVLDISEGKRQSGTQIIQYDLTGKNHQLWDLCDPGDLTSSSSSSN